VTSKGVEIAVAKDGTGTVNAEVQSALNVCINRDAIARLLPQGDNGALIEGYRVVGGKVATLPSFTVPVYVTVPHKVLASGTGYATEQTVNSFDVSRNYVVIPKGTRMVRITLEVPAIKPGQPCSGVELMALLGDNSTQPFTSRLKARVRNCDIDGSVITDASRLRLEYSTLAPKPGLWDLHVFGSYQFDRSRFALKVDYVNAEATPAKLAGPVATTRSGSVALKIEEASMAAQPDAAKSSFELSALYAETAAQVANNDHVFVPAANAVGGSVMREYPAGTQSVKFATGGSPGNDIDLFVFECDTTAKTPDDDSCELAGKSDGPTDVESVTIKPKGDKAYVVRVEGATVKDEGRFKTTETIRLDAEKGTVAVSGSGPDYRLDYAFGPEQTASSKLFGSELFASGRYEVTGGLFARTAEGTTIAVVPVSVSK
jgi:antitoxin component of MazEF toxin-antitoxin module